LASQAYPTQSTHGCSTTAHCHTRQPEHYCRCRQTQYTHGARNRRTHRPVHNSAPDTAPRRHAYIHTRHIHKKRHTFQTSSTISVTKDQPSLLQMPARTPLPAPTNSVHTRRTQSAHPPPGAQLCTRHGSTANHMTMQRRRSAQPAKGRTDRCLLLDSVQAQCTFPRQEYFNSCVAQYTTTTAATPKSAGLGQPAALLRSRM
jgi:hypothetical protein